jgi:hypothetical protein
MRNVLGFLGVFALGLMLSVGCSEDGAPGFPCTEEGIRDAIAEGGGPHTFDCDGAQTVVTKAEIVIDNDVILDGEGNLTVDGDEDHRVFSVPQGVIAELRGLSVRRGTASGEVAEDRSGGGIANDGTLTLTNSTVSDNSATGDHATGGGIASSGMLTLTDSSVSGNSTDAQGGGIDNTYEGTLTLTRSTVSGNSCAYGCGVVNDGTLTLTHSTVSGNSGEYGGGIVSYGTLTLSHSTVSGNSALNGSGIDNFHGTLTLINSTVTGNSGNGGIYNSGTATVSNGTVSGNSGTGVTNYFRGEVTLTNSTVSGNSGSGIYHWGGTTTVTNSTVSGNAASGDRSDIDIYSDADGMVMIARSLIDGDCWPASLGITSLGHNIESHGNTCGFDQETDQAEVTTEQLNLEPLADNGGPTMTHALLPVSVAIDRIPVEDCVDADGQPLTTDQRGEPRPAASGCDVGAFEVQP